MSDTIEHNAMPASIRRQIAEAEQMAREAGIANVPEGPGGDPDPARREQVAGAPDPARAPGAGPVDPQAGDTPADNRTNQGDPLPTGDPTPSGADNEWEQRYKTLQGRFETELNRGREMRGELNSLREIVTGIQRERAPERPPPTITPTGQLVTPKDVEDYGQELIDRVQVWARAAVAPLLHQMELRILAAEGRTNEVTAQTLTQRTDSDLDREVPNWRQINVDQRFLNWLDLYDMFSGQQRLKLLQEAYAAGNSSRCAAFFRAFLEEAQGGAPPSRISPTPPPGPGPGAGPVPLAQLAAPGSGSGPLQPPTGQPNQQTWTGDQITRLSREWQRGLWVGREDEYNRRWEDAVRAGRDGRFRATS